MEKEYLEALECLEKLSKSMPQYDSWIKYIDIIKQALLKEQKNARSEEILQKYYQEGITLDSVRELKKENIELRQKAQEPKQYLKWEDLEFGKTPHKLKCKMNDSLYRIEWFIDGGGFKAVNIYLYVTKDYLEFCTACNKQFFNDLHLERVEE